MDPNEIARILDRANDFLEEGKPADTLRCLSQIGKSLIVDEDRIEAATLRAWALSELGQHDVAIKVIDDMLREFPDSSGLHAAKGVVLSNADDLEEARRSLEYAFAMNDEDEVALANLALVYEKLRDYELAIELYDRAMMMGADMDWAMQRKAAALTELGDYSGAKKTLKRYLSLLPEDGDQWIALGILHSDDEEYDEALECYKNAARTIEDSPMLHLNWGTTAVRAGNLDQAREQLSALKKCAAGTARPWILEAHIVEEDGNLDQADKFYAQAVESIDPADIEDISYTLEMVIDYYARMHRTDDCRKLLKQAYINNACTVELCEAYREATGRWLDEAVWFSVVAEGDYREGLEEVYDRNYPPAGAAKRFLRNYQVVASDRDEAMALLFDFVREMDEKNVRIREFVNDEPIEDTYTGIYEVDRKALIISVGTEI